MTKVHGFQVSEFSVQIFDALEDATAVVEDGAPLLALAGGVVRFSEACDEGHSLGDFGFCGRFAGPWSADSARLALGKEARLGQRRPPDGGEDGNLGTRLGVENSDSAAEQVRAEVHSEASTRDADYAVATAHGNFDFVDLLIGNFERSGQIRTGSEVGAGEEVAPHVAALLDPEPHSFSVFFIITLQSCIVKNKTCPHSRLKLCGSGLQSKRRLNDAVAEVLAGVKPHYGRSWLHRHCEAHTQKNS